MRLFLLLRKTRLYHQKFDGSNVAFSAGDSVSLEDGDTSIYDEIIVDSGANNSNSSSVDSSGDQTSNDSTGNTAASCASSPVTITVSSEYDSSTDTRTYKIHYKRLKW